MKHNNRAFCKMEETKRNINVIKDMECHCEDADANSKTLTALLHQELMEMRLMASKCPRYKDTRKITQLIDNIEQALLDN